MSVYYQDDLVTLYHGDGVEAVNAMDERSVDLVITDPPYDERTHVNSRSSSEDVGASGRALSGSRAAFASMTTEAHRLIFSRLGAVTRRWVVSSLPISTAFDFESLPPEGTRCLRVAVWLKTNPMPSLNGDRPALGWEPIVCLHRADAKPTWNGGGRPMNHIGPTSQGSGHPTQKPIGMVQNWVTLFSNTGDVILDPFAGSGTTLKAAALEGRRAIGYEIEERYCEIAAKRLSQQHLDIFGDAA